MWLDDGTGQHEWIDDRYGTTARAAGRGEERPVQILYNSKKYNCSNTSSCMYEAYEWQNMG